MMVFYFSRVLSSVPGDAGEPSDGHAAVPRRRLQRGSAGGEEALLLPRGQTLHVLLPDRLLPRQGTERRGNRIRSARRRRLYIPQPREAKIWTVTMVTGKTFAPISHAFP